jgi:hypothetical protein
VEVFLLLPQSTANERRQAAQPLANGSQSIGAGYFSSSPIAVQVIWTLSLPPAPCTT